MGSRPARSASGGTHRAPRVDQRGEAISSPGFELLAGDGGPNPRALDAPREHVAPGVAAPASALRGRHTPLAPRGLPIDDGARFGVGDGARSEGASKLQGPHMHAGMKGRLRDPRRDGLQLRGERLEDASRALRTGDGPAFNSVLRDGHRVGVEGASAARSVEAHGRRPRHLRGPGESLRDGTELNAVDEGRRGWRGSAGVAWRARHGRWQTTRRGAPARPEGGSEAGSTFAGWSPRCSQAFLGVPQASPSVPPVWISGSLGP